MEADTKRMRPARPYAMTNLKTQQGLAQVISFIESKGLLAHA
jgi:urease accessory protein